MNKRVSYLWPAVFAISLLGCEINIENPGVDGNNANNANNANNTTNNANNTSNNANNNMANNTTNNANNTSNNTTNNANNTTNNSTNNNTVANGVYPCDDIAEIGPDRCQGGLEWDAFENQALIDRGEYLVNHVMACGDCHMPIRADFTPGANCEPWQAIRDCDRAFAGFNFPFYDTDPFVDGVGSIGIPNITPHPDGLGEWSPEEVRMAVFRGVRPARITDKPRIMFPFMPYAYFAHATVEDQNAVIAYLHSLAPVATGTGPTGILPREPQASGNPWEIMDTLEPKDVTGDGIEDGLGPSPEDSMPAVTLSANDPDYDDAVEGRYLARLACATCHTPGYPPPMGATADDLLGEYFMGDPNNVMAGSNDNAWPLTSWWPGVIFGPAFPDQIRTQNITGHPTFGVGGWTVDELIRSVNGIDKDNEAMCPPMYVDTWFKNLTEDDKRKIAIYMKNSAPNSNDTSGMFFDCKLPAQ